MDGIDHDHPGLPRYTFCYVTAVRSCDPHQSALNAIHVDLEVTLRSRDQRSTIDLNLMRSSYMYIFRCVSMRGSRWYYHFCSSTVSSKVIAKKKNSLILSATILNFLLPATSFFTSPNNGLNKNCRFRSSVSDDIYRLSLACFVFEISGERYPSPPPP